MNLIIIGNCKNIILLWKISFSCFFLLGDWNVFHREFLSTFQRFTLIELFALYMNMVVMDSNLLNMRCYCNSRCRQKISLSATWNISLIYLLEYCTYIKSNKKFNDLLRLLLYNLCKLRIRIFEWRYTVALRFLCSKSEERGRWKSPLVDSEDVYICIKYQ